MKKLIIENKNIVDNRTFHMIELMIQRLYIPYRMIYRGKVDTVSKRKVFWEICINRDVNNFQKLVDFLGCIHEFECVNEHKPLKFQVTNELPKNHR